MIWTSGGNLNIYGNGVQTGLAIGVPLPDVWYHLAIVRSGSTITVYKNGQDKGTITDKNFDNGVGLQIGADGVGTNLVNGFLKNVRITKSALYSSDFEVPTNMTKGSSVLFLKMEGTPASTTFTDSSDSAHTITPQADAQIAYTEDYRNRLVVDDANTTHYGRPEGTAKPIDYLCVLGNGSTYFNGSTSRMLFADSDDFYFDGDYFTMECYFWANDESGDQWTMGSGTSSTSYMTFGISTSNPTYKFYTGNVLRVSCTGTAGDVQARQWNHIAVVKEQDDYTMYLNGRNVGTTNNSFAQQDWTGDFSIGVSDYNGGYTGYFQGKIDNVRISKDIARYTTDFVPPSGSFAGATPLDMTLVSNTFTAESKPDNARIIMFEEDIDTVTLNTDLIGYVSRDGGTTWTAATLENQGDYDTNQRILANTVDISAQPSGVSMVYKIETLNEKGMKEHGTALSWS
jgi:hypothetical protein